MKKVISLVLLCAMLLSGAMVQAAEAPSLDFMATSLADKNYANMEQSGTISYKLNEPFLILDELAKSEDFKEISNYIDVVALFESIFDSKMSVTAKSKITNGGKMISAYTNVKSNLPFKINDNLEGDVRMNESVWMDLDLSNEDKPSFDFIMTYPQAAKYVTADSDLYIQNGLPEMEEFLKIYSQILNSEKVEELNIALIEAIYDRATVTGNSKKVTIKFTDLGLKLYIADVFAIILNEIDESLLEDVDTGVMEDVLAQVPVFGNDALVLKYSLDSKGRMTKQEMEVNVDFNIYDFVVALGGEAEGIDKEGSNLNFTITAETSVKYNTVTINKPELTEENSVDFFEFVDPYYYDTPVEDEYYYDDNYWMYSSVYVDIDKNCIVNNELKYVCLRDLMEEMGYSVFYENGKIFGETENPYTTYKALLFTIGGDTASTDIHDVQLDVPILVIDGVSYISVSDCKKLTGYMDVEYSHYNFFTDYGYMEFVSSEYYNEYFGE